MSGLEWPTAQAATSAAVLTPQAATLLSAGVQAGATLAVGLAQVVLIWAGLRQMNKASADRNRQLDNQEAAAADRHTETMEALRNQSEALRGMVHGLEAVIERTGNSGRA